MRITVLEPLGLSDGQIRLIAESLTKNGHELVIFNDRVEDVEILKKRASGAEILVIANMPLKAEVINSVENLKMISVAFTGVDHVDIKACRERNIAVCNAAGYSTSSVVELTYGLIFSVLRNIVPLDKAIREGKTKAGYKQNDLSGKAIGIVGTGAIGIKVAEIAKAFGCKVLAYSRSEKAEVEALGVKYVSLEELLKESDVVSIHVPLKDDTRALINEEKIGLMKSNAILINTARGGIIDNVALAKALKMGKIAGAGIDVFDMEPPIPKDYLLLKSPNTVLAPHVGFATEEAMLRRAHIVFENIIKWLDRTPQNLV